MTTVHERVMALTFVPDAILAMAKEGQQAQVSAAQQPSTNTIHVVVPAGVAPGMPFRVVQNGQSLVVVCPPNASAGSTVKAAAPDGYASPAAPPPRPATPVDGKDDDALNGFVFQYTDRPTRGPDWPNWARQLMVFDPKLTPLLTKVVPARMSEEVFWRCYFFQVQRVIVEHFIEATPNDDDDGDDDEDGGQ